jgi:hypothetical protein
MDIKLVWAIDFTRDYIKEPSDTSPLSHPLAIGANRDINKF